MDLPVLQMNVDTDGDNGIKCIALVDNPAIQVGWIAFSEEQVKYSIESEDERIIAGPVLIPNQKIYRKFEGIGECYVTCSAEAIKETRNKFFRNKNTDMVSAEHGGAKVQAYLVESFISNTQRGMPSPKPFDKLPDGTLFMSYKIEDEDIWKDVKSGKFLGFSLEGNFRLEEEKSEDMRIMDEIEDLLSSIKKKSLNFYNENHDGDTGQFTEGDSSGGGNDSGYSGAKLELPRTLNESQGKQLAKIAGVPEDFNGKVSFDKGFGSKSTNVYLENEHLKMHRTINENDMTIKNNYIIVKNKDKYSGIQILHDQVNQAVKDGFIKIRCKAVREADANGYYTWPRLGFKPVNEPIEHINNFNKEHGTNVKTLGGMMNSQTGRDYWKANGVEMEMEFDLKEGSYSRKTLAAYHSEKFGKK